MERFAAKIFSATQRYNFLATLLQMVATLFLYSITRYLITRVLTSAINLRQTPVLEQERFDFRLEA